tara:strand:- start:1073 stop:1312 length:240 start_codon:yes stop_codon:yes gene_type:complete
MAKYKLASRLAPFSGWPVGWRWIEPAFTSCTTNNPRTALGMLEVLSCIIQSDLIRAGVSYWVLEVEGVVAAMVFELVMM